MFIIGMLGVNHQWSYRVHYRDAGCQPEVELPCSLPGCWVSTRSGVTVFIAGMLAVKQKWSYRDHCRDAGCQTEVEQMKNPQLDLLKQFTFFCSKLKSI